MNGALTPTGVARMLKDVASTARESDQAEKWLDGLQLDLQYYVMIMQREKEEVSFSSARFGSFVDALIAKLEDEEPGK